MKMYLRWLFFIFAKLPQVLLIPVCQEKVHLSIYNFYSTTDVFVTLYPKAKYSNYLPKF